MELVAACANFYSTTSLQLPFPGSMGKKTKLPVLKAGIALAVHTRVYARRS